MSVKVLKKVRFHSAKPMEQLQRVAGLGFPIEKSKPLSTAHRPLLSLAATSLPSSSITLSTKICLVKAMVFPVVMYGCESWTIKKAERRRTDAFEVWCWRRLLRVPWTARRSNQSILKEINPGYSLAGLMLNLKLQYFGHQCEWLTHLRRPWCWEGLRAGGEGDNRGWDGWVASPTRWTWIWVNSGSWWLTGRPGMLRFMGSQGVGHDWATERNRTYYQRKKVEKNYLTFQQNKIEKEQIKPNII